MNCAKPSHWALSEVSSWMAKGHQPSPLHFLKTLCHSIHSHIVNDLLTPRREKEKKKKWPLNHRPGRQAQKDWRPLNPWRHLLLGLGLSIPVSPPSNHGQIAVRKRPGEPWKMHFSLSSLFPFFFFLSFVSCSGLNYFVHDNSSSFYFLQLIFFFFLCVFENLVSFSRSFSLCLSFFMLDFVSLLLFLKFCWFWLGSSKRNLQTNVCLFYWFSHAISTLFVEILESMFRVFDYFSFFQCGTQKAWKI